MKRFTVFLAASVALPLLFLSSIGLAQQPPKEEKRLPVEVTAVKVEPANAPGGTKPWLRLMAGFTSRPAWADGIAFFYDVLLEKNGDYRVLNGTARYSNVKQGNHAAVLYLSPSAVERFGAPVAAKVRVGYDDEVTQTFDWEASGKSAPEGWNTKFQRYPNQLQPIYLTPFVATEYGKYPDAIASQ